MREDKNRGNALAATANCGNPHAMDAWPDVANFPHTEESGIKVARLKRQGCKD